VVIQPSLGTMKGNDFNSRNQASWRASRRRFAVMAQLKQKLKAKREQ